LNEKRKVEKETIEKKQEEQMQFQRKMDEDNMMAELNMRMGRKEDVGNELT